VTDMGVIGERTVYIDCDVIEADGGTRCVAVTGGYLALHLACKRAVDGRVLKGLPLADSVAAVSVGVIGGEARVDLEYEEDCVAEVDMNVVMTGTGKLIEIQASAEAAPFERQVFEHLLGLAGNGIAKIREAQSVVIAQAYFGDGTSTKP
jgi:ribonuclease PH